MHRQASLGTACDAGLLSQSSFEPNSIFIPFTPGNRKANWDLTVVSALNSPPKITRKRRAF